MPVAWTPQADSRSATFRMAPHALPQHYNINELVLVSVVAHCMPLRFSQGQACRNVRSADIVLKLAAAGSSGAYCSMFTTLKRSLAAYSCAQHGLGRYTTAMHAMQLSHDPSHRPCSTIKRFYPARSKAPQPALQRGSTHTLSLAQGEQADLNVQPDGDGTFTFKTAGSADTVMVLFDVSEDPEEPQQMAADDDSGSERNAEIQAELQSGKQYVLSVRLYYSESESVDVQWS